MAGDAVCQIPVSGILYGYREFTGKLERTWPENSGLFRDFVPEVRPFLLIGGIPEQGV